MNEHTHPGDVEKKLYYTPEELVSKSSFEESIPERTKMRRQKNSDEESQEAQ